MKDKKKLSIILGVVGVALIIFGIILSFISNVKKDQKEMNSRMDTIVTEYSKFEKNIEEFNKLKINCIKKSACYLSHIALRRIIDNINNK